MTLTPQEVFSIMTAQGPWCGIDVRSEGEFIDGHWSGFKNKPILNNDHRHLVGTTYKKEGQEAAILLGMKLVEPLKPSLVEEWSGYFQQIPREKCFVTCWRGGLRSKFTQNWLAESGLKVPRVQGGVKAIRQLSLDLLHKGPKKILLVGGMTGNGKTELLQELPQELVIDLEALAHHRGSSFGGYLQSPQPSQSTFENNLSLEIYKKPDFAIMEAESRLIGKRVIPSELKKKMDTCEIVILDSPMEERVERLYREYVLEPVKKYGEEAVMADLKNKLLKIERKLGGLQTQITLKKLEDKQHRAWIEDLLVHYYDKLYEHAMKSKSRTTVFRGNKKEVLEYCHLRRHS